MADETTNGAAGAPAADADAAKETARLFGQGDAPPGGVAPGSPGAVPEGFVEKYWNAAKGDPTEYAKVLSEGYRQLNGQFTQATQAQGDDKPGEVPEAYWAERTDASFAEKFARLDFSDMESVRDLYRAAHGEGWGPKRTNAPVDAYLTLRNKAAPEVETDEARRSRVIHELGPQGAQKAAAVATWVSGMKLDAAQVQALAPVAESAAGMEALFRMSRATLGAPPAGGAQGGGQEAREAEIAQLKADLADPEKAFTSEVRARYARLVKPGHTLDGQPLSSIGSPAA